jgi:hypothetical protein
MVNYITNKDTIIFSPFYDESINPNLLSLYNKIIFSNYKLNEDLFEKYENLDFKGLKWFGFGFNQKVDLPENLTHLTFNDDFNQEVHLPKNLTHLTFGWKFNQKVELPDNLTHLTFGRWFNKEVELPENLTHLTFGCRFNQKVELPEKITHLTFGYYFNQEVHLPENLTHLTFGENFNQKVELPLGIKYLKLENDEDYNLDYLPEGIEELDLGEYFQDDTLYNLPNSLKVIRLHNKCVCNLKCLPSNTKIEYYKW